MEDNDDAMQTQTHTHNHTETHSNTISIFRAACTDAQTNMQWGGLEVMCYQNSHFTKQAHVEHGESE